MWAWPPISSPAKARVWSSGRPLSRHQQPGASNTLLGAVGGVAYANGTLFVADSNRTGLIPINNRVLRVSHPVVSRAARSDSALHRALRGVRGTGQRGAGPTGFRHHHFRNHADRHALADRRRDRWNDPGGGGYRQQSRPDLEIDSDHDRSAGGHRTRPARFQDGPAGIAAGGRQQEPPQSAGRVDSERQAVRGRYAESPRPDLEFDSHAEPAAGRRGAGAGQLQRGGPAGSDQGRTPTRTPTRCSIRCRFRATGPVSTWPIWATIAC